MDEKNETGPAVEPKQEQQCKQARPHDELICELLDSRRPKTEREHAAAREIERLRAELAEFKEDAERYRWLRYPRMGWDIVRKTDGELLCAEYLDGIELDAAIDTARKGKEE